MPYFADIADDVWYDALALTRDFQDLSRHWDEFYPSAGLVGMDPDIVSAAQNAQRKAATGYQHGIFLSKNVLPMAISEAQDMADHLRQAKEIIHPFECPPSLPKDLEFSLTSCLDDPSGLQRGETQQTLHALAVAAAPLDARLRERMAPTVRQVAGTMRLGLLMCFIILLKRPDWHLPQLYVKGFPIAGYIPLSNIYPAIRRGPDL